MTSSRMRHLFLAAMFVSVSGHAQAPSWPEGPVTIITSNSPGSTPDVAARMAAQALSEGLGQSFIVDNRPGGRSIIATMAVARAAPDGYTLYVSGNTALSANEFLVKNLPYDPERDFSPIAMVIDSAPLLLTVNAKLPVKTLDDLIRLAKASPGKYTYAVSGTLPPIMGQLLAKSAGIALREVRYKNTSQSVLDTATGITDMTLLGLPSVGSFIKENKLRIITTISSRRSPFLPEVPSLEETYPGISMEGWFVLLGPAGIPPEVADKIGPVLDRYLKRPETLAKLHELGLTTRGAQSPSAVRAFIHSERERWAKIVKFLGLKPD